MKVTLESTTETAHANGLPVRVWTGTTDRGSGVIALITRLAVPDDAHPDDIAQIERELAEAPTRVRDPSGSHVAAPRHCTVCLGRGVERPAVQVARDAGGVEWFECGQHTARDNLMGTERVAIEGLDSWFDRQEERVTLVDDVYAHRPRQPVDERETLEQSLDAVSARIDEILELGSSRGSALVKDFWVLYSAARQLNEALITALGESDDEAAERSADRGERVARYHQGLALQLDRLEPAFQFCEAERRGEPSPASAARDVAAWRAGLVTPSELAHAELVHRARERCPRHDLLGVRHAVSSWLHHDEVTLIGPGNLARMILGALDALAIVHGADGEADAVELDAFIARTEGDPTRPPPRARTEPEREALEALHRWLHHPRGDGDLIEAAAAFHEQIASERPGECDRLDAEIHLEQRAERDEAARCRACGCTETDCSGCIARTGEPCHWVERDLCSACAPPATFPDTRPKDITGEPIAGDPPAREVTPAMREWYRDELCRRAPETLNDGERAIIAAVEAEERQRASDPETWVDGGGS